MREKNLDRAGFTLIELVVVILIIGILAAIGYPQYILTMETAKANDAVALLTMGGNANRMYALDHSNSGATCSANNGYTSGLVSNATCSGGACVGDCSSACDVVYCGYLAQDNYDGKPYTLSLQVPGATIATVARRTGASPGTNTSPYNGWGYQMASGSAIVSATGNAPPPPQ